MCAFDPSASKIDFEKVLKPCVSFISPKSRSLVHPFWFLDSCALNYTCRMFGQTPDEEVVKANLATLNAKLDAYEKILSKQKYIGGEVCIKPQIVNSHSIRRPLSMSCRTQRQIQLSLHVPVSS